MGNWINPVKGSPGFIDSAETFAESDVTLNLPWAAVSSESIQLSGTSGQSRFNNWGATSSLSAKGGHWVKIEDPGRNITGFDFTVDGDSSGYSRAGVENLTDGTTVTTKSFSSTSGSFTGLSLDPTKDYAVWIDDGGSSWTAGEVGGGGTDPEIMNRGTWDSSNGKGGLGGVQDVTVNLGGEPHDTSTTVSWSMPPDIASWDEAYFEALEDGGTIEVYAIDGSGNRLVGPLSDPGDISDVSNTTNVGFEIVLSRTDPSTQNPRLKNIYRRRKIT